MGKISSEVDGDEESGLHRQPSSATAGSVPARPGAYRVESRAPNSQRRRGRARGREEEEGSGSHPNGAGTHGIMFEDGIVAEAECTDAAEATTVRAQQPHAATTSVQISLPASRVDEGQTQVVEALHTAVIEDDDGGVLGNITSPHQQHTDRIRKKDWIIVSCCVGVAVIVVGVTLGIRLS